MRQTTKAHWACPDPQILLAKSDYFSGGEEEEEEEEVQDFQWFALPVST